MGKVTMVAAVAAILVLFCEGCPEQQHAALVGSSAVVDEGADDAGTGGDHVGDGEADAGVGDEGAVADAGAPDDLGAPSEVVKDAGVEQQPEVESQWYVGIWNVRSWSKQSVSLPCGNGSPQVWHVHVSSTGVRIDRENFDTLWLKRLAWGFEGQGPEGYYSVSFNDINDMQGSIAPFGPKPLKDCASAVLAGQYVGPNIDGAP